MAKSNLAYKTNLNYKENYKTLPAKTTHIGRVKKRKLATIKPSFYIVLIALTSTVLSFYITNLVKSSELNFKINAAKKQYELQKSEGVRLHSLLETNCLNSAEIEKYAKMNLGMKKQNNSQVHYICRSKGNLAQIKTNNKGEVFKKSENFLDKIKNCLKAIIK